MLMGTSAPKCYSRRRYFPRVPAGHEPEKGGVCAQPNKQTARGQACGLGAANSEPWVAGMPRARAVGAHRSQRLDLRVDRWLDTLNLRPRLPQSFQRQPRRGIIPNLRTARWGNAGQVWISACAECTR